MVILPTANVSLMAHELSKGGRGVQVVQFAEICVVTGHGGHKKAFEEYIYPTGLALSMACLVATFLLYSFLPQLRRVDCRVNFENGAVLLDIFENFSRFFSLLLGLADLSKN